MCYKWILIYMYIYLHIYLDQLPVAIKDCIFKRLYSDLKHSFSECNNILCNFIWLLLKVCSLIRSSLASLVCNHFFRTLVNLTFLFWIRWHFFLHFSSTYKIPIMVINYHDGYFVCWWELHVDEISFIVVSSAGELISSWQRPCSPDLNPLDFHFLVANRKEIYFQ